MTDTLPTPDIPRLRKLLTMTDTLPTPDIPRLRKLVAWVEEEETKPEDDREWDQREWLVSPALWGRPETVDAALLTFDCGTKACVCGRLAIEDGARIGFGPCPCGCGSGSALYNVLTFDGKLPEHYGGDALGLTGWEASDLFNLGNTAADVRRVAEAIAARVGERL